MATERNLSLAGALEKTDIAQLLIDKASKVRGSIWPQHHNECCVHVAIASMLIGRGCLQVTYYRPG